MQKSTIISKVVNLTSYGVLNYKDITDCDKDRMMFTLQALFNALVVIPSTILFSSTRTTVSFQLMVLLCTSTLLLLVTRY